MPNNKKIIHIVIDDKFIDMALREFESVAPGLNLAVILGPKRILTYIKNTEIEFHTTESINTLFQSNEYCAVVFHSLGDSSLLSAIPIDKKVIWLGWGYDYYHKLLSSAYPTGLLLDETKKLLDTSSRPAKTTKLPIFLFYFQKIKNIVKISLSKIGFYQFNLLERIDIFSPVLDIEYDMACKLNPWFKPQYLPWNYGTVEDDLTTNNTNEPLGINILVGNSATFENNHLEVFEILDRYVDLTNRKIIVPLSYGNDSYKNKLISIGQDKFGDKFIPLTDFMDKDEYISLLQSCGHVFMNHLRQQALGNICIMMLKGAKIYMHPDNPLYHWLTIRGAIVHSINALNYDKDNKKYALQHLSEREKINNIKVIQSNWGQNIQRTKTRHLIDASTTPPKRSWILKIINHSKLM